MLKLMAIKENIYNFTLKNAVYLNLPVWCKEEIGGAAAQELL